MRKVLSGAVVAACLAVAACSAAPPAPPAPAVSSTPAAPATTAAASNGVTTATDVFGSGCSALTPDVLTALSGQPVATAAASVPTLREFAGALGKVDGLSATLDAARGLTVLAPADTAFAQARTVLGPARFTDLLADQPLVTALVSGHVVGERRTAAELRAARSVPALAGGSLTFSGSPDAPTVTDATGRTATVLCGNIPTANATLFVVDTVFLPRV